MATIVQDYGPIYGEAVNGTVQGRPNGSVYVPSSNTIEINIGNIENVYIDMLVDKGVGYLYLLNVPGYTARQCEYVANAQDLASYIMISVYTDAECTTQLGSSRPLAAGSFNGGTAIVAICDTDPTAGVSYYIRAQLCNNGSAVATSSVLEVKGFDGE